MEHYRNKGFLKKPRALIFTEPRGMASMSEDVLSRGKTDLLRTWARISCDLFTFRAVIVLAFGLRLFFTLISADSANDEGICYLRIAENLIAGIGNVGIRENGMQFLYPPLFPGLIALVTTFVGNAEMAARLINIFAGTALVIPVFLIGRRLGNERVALLAAVLVVVHPYLIAMSTVILSETLYMLLLLTGVYGVISAGTNQSPRPALLAGVCFGLAYLVRPEGMVFAMLGAVALSLVQFGKSFSGLRIAAALLVCTAVIAMPYIAWLTNSTGQFLLESKSAENYATKSQMLANVPLEEIYFGLNDDLSGKGSSMISNLEVIQKYHLRPYDAAMFALGTAPQSVPDVARQLALRRLLGSPALVVLVLLSLANGIRRRELWLVHGSLLAVVAGTFFALLLVPTHQMFYDRYLFPFLPPMLIWAADGIAVLSIWVGKKCGAQHRPQLGTNEP